MFSGRMLTKGNNTDPKALFIWSGMLFLISFIYFSRFGNGIFFLQETKSLFIFSPGYLHDFIIKPGGLLEYAGNFFTQGYFIKIYASLATSLTSLIFIGLFIRINKLLSEDNSFSLLLVLIPSCLLMLTQVREDHFIHHTIGYLLTIVFYIATIKLSNRKLNYLVPLIFPLAFYLIGSFALLFLLITVVYYLVFKKGIQEYLLPVVLILTAFITFYIFKEIFFLQPPDQLFRYPSDIIDINNLTGSKIILSGYIVIFPLIVKIIRKSKPEEKLSLFLSRGSLIILFSATIFLMGASYDPKRRDDLKIEEFFYEQNWDTVISLQEKFASKNEFSQYYYNLALTEKGQLCDRMFYSRQDYGIKSLMLPREREYKSRSVYFYYAIGLINEAHHQAYESMVINGYSSEILKVLIKTDLISGDFKSAERNINILKKTLHFRKWADKYEKMVNRPDIVISDPELGEKIKLMPEKDFFISSVDEENIDLVLMSNPDNKKAFEYKMASLLLKKDYKAVMYQVKRMKDMDYTRIPGHIAESMIIFKERNEELPYLGDFKISPETESRFYLFLNDTRNNKAENRTELEKSMKNRWGNTFWYYFEFK